MGPTIFKFLEKVSDNDLRPVFDVPVKPSIRKLIESCWSKNPDERPTFEEIFNKLAYNSKDFSIDVYNENEQHDEQDFYMDDVDIEKVLKYVDSINNSELVDLKSRYEAEIAKLRSEIKYLRVNQILKEIEIEMSQNTESNSIFRTANRSRNNQEILKVGQQFIDSRYSRNWDKKVQISAI